MADMTAQHRTATALFLYKQQVTPADRAKAFCDKMGWSAHWGSWASRFEQGDSVPFEGMGQTAEYVYVRLAVEHCDRMEVG